MIIQSITYWWNQSYVPSLHVYTFHYICTSFIKHVKQGAYSNVHFEFRWRPYQKDKLRLLVISINLNSTLLAQYSNGNRNAQGQYWPFLREKRKKHVCHFVLYCLIYLQSNSCISHIFILYSICLHYDRKGQS